MNIRYQIEKLSLILFGPFTRNYTANKCKHKTKAKGVIRYFGHEDIMRNKFEDNGSPDYCFDCLVKMTIQCTWCGEPITVGSPVCMSIPVDPEYKIPEFAVKHNNGYVGCLRSSCSDGGMDRNGFWMPPGEVLRVPTIFEILLHNNGEAIIIHDIGNPNDHGTIV